MLSVYTICMGMFGSGVVILGMRTTITLLLMEALGRIRIILLQSGSSAVAHGLSDSSFAVPPLASTQPRPMILEQVRVFELPSLSHNAHFNSRLDRK
jgi:hypothetical protein